MVELSEVKLTWGETLHVAQNSNKWEGLFNLSYVSQGKKKIKYFTQLLSLVDNFFATQYDEDLMKGWLIGFSEEFIFKLPCNQHFQLY